MVLEGGGGMGVGWGWDGGGMGVGWGWVAHKGYTSRVRKPMYNVKVIKRNNQNNFLAFPTEE
jgi:hypothetical protein